jgi:hypothetical protein
MLRFWNHRGGKGGVKSSDNWECSKTPRVFAWGMANGTREQAMSIEMVATGAGDVLAMRLCCSLVRYGFLA